MSGKKNFSLDYNTDPIMQFITPPQDTEEPDTQAEQEPKQKKPRARKKTAEQTAKRDRWLNAPAGTREPRTKRTQILLPPSLHDEAKEYAEQHGISLNELVIRGLYELLDKGEI